MRQTNTAERYMPANEPPPARIIIIDDSRKVEISGAAAQMIRMIVEQANFFNAPYSAGVVHFHFNGRERSANLRSELTLQTQ